ncbi:MAG: hydroxymethylglutaryl-CoA lyase, partial [Pyramidobacter sp.]|nr:hydroxymethylglutaryl-CoA lyase [Pyramidobacter sp.]
MHVQASSGKTPKISGKILKITASSAAGIGISGSISMAFGSPWDKEIPLSDVKEIVDAYLAVGVTEISLSDAS